MKEYDAPPTLGPVDLGVRLHLYEETWSEDPFSPRNILVLGAGLFAGSKIFGSHRLVAVFRSPLSGGLHVSELGGAAYKFIGCGAHAVVLRGRSEKPSILLIEGSKEGVNRVDFVSLSEDELNRIYSGYRGHRGAYALALWIADNFGSFIEGNNARPVVVGPAAFKTRMGAIVSVDIDPAKKQIVPGSEDFAARGGGGSVMAKAHNVAAIVAGGNWRPQLPPELLDPSKLSELFKKTAGKDYIQAVTAATVKYRHDPSIGAGGTFGVNYPHYRELLPLFNYNSIYLRKEVRRRIVEIILEKYWKPFKEEVFDKAKTWATCGEPCPVACKKVWRGKKVDYEPFQGVGPLIGVTDLELASKVVDAIDQLGFDAIELGHVAAWILEAVYRGLLTPEEVGLNVNPNMDPTLLNPELWNRNSELALKIVEGLVEKRTEVLRLVAELGIRRAAKELDKRFEERVKKLGIKFEDLVVYQPYGSDWYMTPNFYWTPGFIVPIFVTGKYWTNYSTVFTEPEEFAKTVYSRAIKELQVANAGVCRFHRGWAEQMLPTLYRVLGIQANLDEHAKETYRLIAEYNIKAGAVPQLLEGIKSIDILFTLAEELNVQQWLDKFAKDKNAAYREWVDRFSKAYLQLVGVQQFA